MSTEFLRLYRELEKYTPSTVYDEKKLTDQRNDVMYRLGYKGIGGGVTHTKCAKFHGKKAREFAHDARQSALKNDAKVKAERRMEVHEAVHGVARLVSLTKELGTYVKSQEPVPGGLMRKLVGNDAMRKKAPPQNDGPKDLWKLPTIPREPRQVRKDFTTNAWSLDERMMLNKIYVEMPKPTVKTKLDSWKVFYESVASRFIQFFPHRTLKETIEKLEDLIHRRVIKEVGETEYWEGVRSPNSKVKTNDPPTVASRSTALSQVPQSKQQVVKFGGSLTSSVSR